MRRESQLFFPTLSLTLSLLLGYIFHKQHCLMNYANENSSLAVEHSGTAAAGVHQNYLLIYYA